MPGIAMALKDCPDKEDLNILTDSLSAMVLPRSMQRKDLPLWLYRHTERQLLHRSAYQKACGAGAHHAPDKGTDAQRGATQLMKQPMLWQRLQQS